MTAIGRKRPFILASLVLFERLLQVKADIWNVPLENPLWNVRYAPESSRSATIGAKGCL